MTTWEVLRFDDSRDAWHVMGEIGSEYSYSPGLGVAAEIGERYGAGQYLLLSDEGRYVRLNVAARTEFYEVPVEEAEPESEPETAAAVMERDG